MKKGFTLAEVLITLAVIGVVAALTIPVLVQKYQKKQLYSQFMKMYNTVSTVMDNTIAEYGEPNEWKWGKWRYNYETGEDELVDAGDSPVENYIFSQLKYVKKCDSAKDCFADEYTGLNGNSNTGSGYGYGSSGYDITEMIFYYTEEYGSGGAVVLADGSALAIGGDESFMAITFDTNGKKGPNVLGRDLFMIFFDSDGDGYSNESSGFELIEYEEGENCDSNSNDSENGLGCASRLLQEGKMNY